MVDLALRSAPPLCLAASVPPTASHGGVVPPGKLNLASHQGLEYSPGSTLPRGHRSLAVLHLLLPIPDAAP
eukprot:NODE_4635_length_324_cov_44.523636_g4190_i0.p3 GENE.NODE_4635_length_324_cov_44.523636_g4190_i0~~NODE_4635_length_324_cov_44.523636_g4190_i0.p3  ORF type:complete len:71 (+),score=13.91 NODE_4635_length_324_cov_44.523636_g4190_i0:55-267(+)